MTRAEHEHRIDLLRHGETEGPMRYCGVTDVPLTPSGWNQMRAATDQPRGWQVIHSSPLKRCAEFARALGERLGIPVRIDARLREINFGNWENRTSQELMEQDPDALLRFWENPWLNGPANSEPLEQLNVRVLDAWSEIANQQESALLISHGGPLRVIYAHVHGWPREQFLNIEIPHATLLSFGPAQRARSAKRA